MIQNGKAPLAYDTKRLGSSLSRYGNHQADPYPRRAISKEEEVNQILTLHEVLVSRLPELYESRHDAESDGNGDYDYVSGLIDGYSTALRLAGIPDTLIPKDPYEEED